MYQRMRDIASQPDTGQQYMAKIRDLRARIRSSAPVHTAISPAGSSVPTMSPAPLPSPAPPSEPAGSAVPALSPARSAVPAPLPAGGAMPAASLAVLPGPASSDVPSLSPAGAALPPTPAVGAGPTLQSAPPLAADVTPWQQYMAKLRAFRARTSAPPVPIPVLPAVDADAWRQYMAKLREYRARSLSSAPTPAPAHSPPLVLAPPGGPPVETASPGAFLRVVCVVVADVHCTSDASPVVAVALPERRKTLKRRTSEEVLAAPRPPIHRRRADTVMDPQRILAAYEAQCCKHACLAHISRALVDSLRRLYARQRSEKARTRLLVQYMETGNGPTPRNVKYVVPQLEGAVGAALERLPVCREAFLKLFGISTRKCTTARRVFLDESLDLVELRGRPSLMNALFLQFMGEVVMGVLTETVRGERGERAKRARERAERKRVRRMAEGKPVARRAFPAPFEPEMVLPGFKRWRSLREGFLVPWWAAFKPTPEEKAIGFHPENPPSLAYMRALLRKHFPKLCLERTVNRSLHHCGTCNAITELIVRYQHELAGGAGEALAARLRVDLAAMLENRRCHTQFVAADRAHYQSLVRLARTQPERFTLVCSDGIGHAYFPSVHQCTQEVVALPGRIKFHMFAVSNMSWVGKEHWIYFIPKPDYTLSWQTCLTVIYLEHLPAYMADLHAQGRPIPPMLIEYKDNAYVPAAVAVAVTVAVAHVSVCSSTVCRSSENKNSYTMEALRLPVHTGLFSAVEQHHLPVGHTFCKCVRSFCRRSYSSYSLLQSTPTLSRLLCKG